MLLSKGKVLVTGGAGFIGSHQVDALIESGYKVVVIDNLSTGKASNLNPKAKFYKADIRDEEIEEIFIKEKPEHVFHFAAQINVNKSVGDPIYDADVNIIGSLNVLDVCVDHQVKSVFFSSTGGALYGEAEEIPTTEEYPCSPLSPYGISKLCVESYLRFYKEQFGLTYSIARYANVYGPRQESAGESGVINIFTKKILEKEQVLIHGDGHQTRDFIHVRDVVAANTTIFEKGETEIFNVSTGRQTTINEIYAIIKGRLEMKTSEKYVDVFSGPRASCLSSEKLERHTKWRPTVKLATGMEETVDWIVNKYSKK